MNRLTRILIPVVIFGLYYQHAPAQQPFRVKTFSLTVRGTSTLHDWESKVEKVDFRGLLTVSVKHVTNVTDAVVIIPVRSIKSPKGKLMDNKTYDVFSCEKNPSIIFTMADGKVDAGKRLITAAGTLAMAGTSRPTELMLTFNVAANGDVRITGSKKLNMVDFKMDPPTAMMGTIQVGKEVVVDIDVTLAPATALTKQN